MGRPGTRHHRYRAGGRREPLDAEGCAREERLL